MTPSSASGNANTVVKPAATARKMTRRPIAVKINPARHATIVHKAKQIVNGPREPDMGSAAAAARVAIRAAKRVLRSGSPSPIESKRTGTSTAKSLKPEIYEKVDETRARPVLLTSIACT